MLGPLFAGCLDSIAKKIYKNCSHYSMVGSNTRKKINSQKKKKKTKEENKS